MWSVALKEIEYIINIIFETYYYLQVKSSIKTIKTRVKNKINK